jgi:hypothetical protein
MLGGRLRGHPLALTGMRFGLTRACGIWTTGTIVCAMFVGSLVWSMGPPSGRVGHAIEMSVRPVTLVCGAWPLLPSPFLLPPRRRGWGGLPQQKQKNPGGFAPTGVSPRKKKTPS